MEGDGQLYGHSGCRDHISSLTIGGANYLTNLLCDFAQGQTVCATIDAGNTSSAATDTAVSVQINPNSPGLVATGSALSANSVPVVIASDQSAISVTTSGTQTVQGTTAAGSGSATNLVTVQGNASGTAVPVSGTVTATPTGTYTVSGTVTANPAPTTSGGLTTFFLQPAASDNHTNIKNGAGQVYKIDVFNNSATVNYLRLYNAATGFNGCNSATNLVYQLEIPALTTVGGVATSWDLGMTFSTGISLCVTGGYSTSDTTNATASAMAVNIGYK